LVTAYSIRVSEADNVKIASSSSYMLSGRSSNLPGNDSSNTDVPFRALDWLTGAVSYLIT